MQRAMDRRTPIQSAMDRIGSAWTPATLFANNERGVWYDPSDLSTLFQDDAGTTPVTAVGQPVGRMLDKSVRGNHATQATAAARPVLQQDGNGKYYLAFDGVDDWLGITGASALAITGDLTLHYGVYLGAANGNIVSCQTAAGTDNAYESRVGGFGAEAQIQLVHAAASVQTINSNPALANANAPSVVSVLRGGGNVVHRIDLDSPSTTAQTETPTAGASPVFRIGLRQDGSLPLNGRIYSLIVRGALSDASQIAAAEAYVNSKTGAY